MPFSFQKIVAENVNTNRDKLIIFWDVIGRICIKILNGQR